jgi:hypothetical protein
MGFADKYGRQGQFMKKEDLPRNKGINLKIESWSSHDWGDGEPPQLVLHWTNNRYSPLCCNKTNTKLAEVLTGADSEDGLVGHVLNVYHDPTIMFAGKVIGGLRLQAKQERPEEKPKEPEPPVPQNLEEVDPTDDDIPF